MFYQSPGEESKIRLTDGYTNYFPSIITDNSIIDDKKEVKSCGCQLSNRFIRKAGQNQRKDSKKFVSKYAFRRKAKQQEMKFHFSIIGHAESPEEVLLVEWLQDMIYQYNKDSGSPLDSWHVLVREDAVQE